MLIDTGAQLQETREAAEPYLMVRLHPKDDARLKRIEAMLLELTDPGFFDKKE